MGRRVVRSKGEEETLYGHYAGGHEGCGRGGEEVDALDMARSRNEVLWRLLTG